MDKETLPSYFSQSQKAELKHCCACGNLFDKKHYIPKILFDCFHVVCVKCIKNYWYLESSDAFFYYSFDCPICYTKYRNIDIKKLKTARIF